MVTYQEISWIVGTYDLSKHKQQKMLTRLCHEVREGWISTFDDCYRRAGELADWLRRPRDERYPLRQDLRLRDSVEHIVEKVLGTKTKHPYFGDTQPQGESILIREAVSILDKNLDELHLRMLDYLLKEESKDRKVYLSLETVSAHLPEIRQRLDEVIRYYERDGRLIVPPRPIVEIKWNPKFWVKYGRRKFHGNPLQFFREHADVYAGMSRQEVRRFDPGLIMSLYRSGQMDEAIPERTSNYAAHIPLEEEQRIVQLYAQYGGNATHLAQAIDRTPAVVLRVFREHNLPILPRGRRPGNRKFSSDQIEAINALYESSGGNAVHAASISPYARTTITRYWHLSGKKIHRPGGREKENKKNGNCLPF